MGRDPNIKCFEIRYAAFAADGTAGAWQSGGFSTKSRNMSLQGLVPGQMYNIAVRAIVGATGRSEKAASNEARVNAECMVIKRMKSATGKAVRLLDWL